MCVFKKYNFSIEFDCLLQYIPVVRQNVSSVGKCEIFASKSVLQRDYI